jgi:hypothetical protein
MSVHRTVKSCGPSILAIMCLRLQLQSSQLLPSCRHSCCDHSVWLCCL